MDGHEHETGNRQKGHALEQRAADYLAAHGLQPITANYHCRAGEIDLIMRDREFIVFVEVRFRRSSLRGSPLESVTAAKQRKLIRCARHYLMTQWLHESVPCRFDVVGLGPGNHVAWIRNAFGQLPV